MRVARAVWLVPGGLLAGAVCARVSLGFAPATTATGLAQALPIVTAWGGYGAVALGLLALSIAIGAIGYIAVLRALARGDELALRTILAASACALIAAFAWPFAFSSDVYAYAAYGDLAAHGISPYAHLLHVPNDATMRAALWQWNDALPACVYGPFFVWIARALGSLAALRGLAAIALLACAPLAYSVFAGRPRSQRLLAAAAIALNPLALWSAAEGHNDAIALALGLAGFALARRYGTFLGALLATLSLGVKAAGGIAVLGMLAAYRAPARRRVAAIGGIVVGGALVAIAYLPYARDLLAPGAHGSYQPFVSLQAIWPPLGIAAAIAALGFGVRSIVRGEIAGWALAALGLWLAIPNPQPWYGLWFLPIAALAPRSIAAWVLVGLSLTTILRYVPDAVATPGYPLDLTLSSLAFAPLLLLCLHFRPKP